jgi:DNA-binding NtrC family response regulator
VADRIAVIEDDRELRELLHDILRDAGYEAITFATAEAALRELPAAKPELVLTDLMLPGMTGAELLAEIRRLRPDLHVIAMTAFGSIESAIELVKAGAFNYLTKPLSTDELLLAVERALADSASRRELARAGAPDAVAAPAEFIGKSAPMQEL